MSLSLVRPTATELKPRIVVFGVGGAGGNAVNNMIDAGLEGVEFVVANTDAQHLSFAKTDRRIQLGETITQGLGAGAHPEVGMNAAEESADEIHAHLEGAHMVFITAGMGGGTGTGAAPIIAKCARDRGILTVGVVTKPFTFEGRHRMRLADAGIAELQRYVDTLIVIPNQNLFRVANERTTFADAFGMADQVLHSGVRSITDLMILPGLINLDFADVRAVMSEMGKAMMGTGEASGDDRALLAAQNAIANPLLDETSLKGAKAVLVNITGGLDMTLLEVDEAANAISAEVDGDANIIFGAAFDPALDGKIRVSVVATGMDEVGGVRAEPVSPPQSTYQDPRRAAPTAAAPTRAPEPARREPIRAEAAYRAPEPAPVVPTFQAPPPVARAPEPVIHVAEEPRALEPIIDPWVEEFEAAPARPAATAQDQGDLYMDSGAQAPREYDEPAYDDRDHRRSGWSLFGKKPRAQTAYAPVQQNPQRGQPQMRATAQPAPEPLQAEDDLEIPSFLRRLAN
ncbi:cell division protein FtsZ [Brevundimonas subvibrioides]|uniref:Cell division protein FtsZ n=1 Tax=Brevundimonas subvibrioides (strain ATCC 15264 / DSM 4735 / LMG 14903 / NBRC 16000 / CB 81) TaxID=633149 RepID=D9QM67_BRESC|nr:cell division protein FtsZ [Brevundimonas subvibrioides]ADL01993.1 cell division protein FtsZ [Brevundimonas subvibrioides ATCC 15264]